MTLLSVTPRSVSGIALVANNPLQLGVKKFVRVDNGSEQMNIDGVPAGADTVVWNGTGGSDTGGDWTASGTGTETAGSKYEGTNGWDTGSATKDSYTVFDYGSLVDIDGTYSTIHFWMNPQAFPASSELKIEWRNNGDAKIGSTLLVNNYVTAFDIGVWQLVSIPIADFGLTTNVQKLRITYAKTAGQQYYFDSIHLHPSAGGGGPYIFRIAAETGYVLRTDSISLVISDEDTGWTSSGFAGTSALSSGLLIRQVDTETAETLWSINLKDNIDIFGALIVINEAVFSNGDHLFTLAVRPDKRVKAAVTVTDTQVVEIVVRDDLSDITHLRAYLQYGKEDIVE